MSSNRTLYRRLRSDYIYLGTLVFTLCILSFSYSYADSIEVPADDNSLGPVYLDWADSIIVTLPAIGGMTDTAFPEPLVAAGSVPDTVKNDAVNPATGGGIRG